MIKKLWMLFFVIPSLCFGAATGMDWNESSGIVTPEIGTGVQRTARFNYDINGEIVICLAKYELSRGYDACLDKENKNAWRSIKDSVPSGKKYIGFKSVSGYYGRHEIEIYWK